MNTHASLQASSSFTTGAPVPIERPATAEPAAFRAGQEPSPAAPSDATSIGDAQRPSTPKAQASGESPASGNRTSSGAGAAETTPNGKGVAPGVPVSSGKAKATKVGFSSVYTVACAHLMSVPKLNSAAAQTCLV
jgi:hypothetical protein